MKVCDGIYAYIWRGVFENNCNTYYLGEPFNMLIDPGLRKYVDLHFTEMQKDGLDPAAIAVSAATHCHPDHFEGMIPLAEKNIPLAMHKDEIAFLNEEGPAFFRMFGMPFPDLRFGAVLEEGPWKVGGGELEVYHTPGHSPGSVCLYWREKKALVCGDLVFEQSFGRVDFPGGDPQALVSSIKRISQLDIEYLLPGHMNMISGAANIKRNFQLISQFFTTL